MQRATSAASSIDPVGGTSLEFNVADLTKVIKVFLLDLFVGSRKFQAKLERTPSIRIFPVNFIRGPHSSREVNSPILTAEYPIQWKISADDLGNICMGEAQGSEIRLNTALYIP